MIATVVLVPLLVLGSSVAWFFWQLDGHGDPGPVGARATQRGWGVPADRPGVAPRAHRRLVARVQRVRALQRRQFVPGRNLRHARERRREGGRQGAQGRPSYRLRQAHGAARAVAPTDRGPRRSPPGRNPLPFLQGTRNNAVRSLYEPTGVSNLEGLVRPDTYKVSNSQDEISILQSMVTAFDTHAREARAHRRRQRPLRLRHHQGGVVDRVGSEGAAGPTVDRCR